MDHFYDEGIRGQLTRLLAAQKVVQITVCVLHHILVNDESLIWTVIYFLFGSTETKILANDSRNVSKLLIFLDGATLRNSCFTYFI
jgi:hypothetical protein